MSDRRLIIGLDLGSRRIGVCVAWDQLPLHVVLTEIIAVEPTDVGSAVSAILARLSSIEIGLLAQVVIEHGRFYVGTGKSPAAIAAMVEAHGVTSIIRDRLETALRERSIPVTVMARKTWASRVLPHTRGGITDQMANDGMRAHVHVDVGKRLDEMGQDERDAVGCVLGWVLPKPGRKPRTRRSLGEPRPVLTAEQKADRRRARVTRYLARKAAEVRTAKLSAGCNGCIRKHVRSCPLFRPKHSDL